MLFTIPAWQNSGELKHEKTTWYLTRDKDGKDVELKEVESKDNLLAWDPDVVIPTGEIWYIKALRHLIDAEGKVINNHHWIGPKPVFNEESNINDYLAPKFHVKETYLTKLEYVPGKGLDLSFIPFSGNIGYIDTLVSISDMDGNILTNDYINLEDSLNYTVSSKVIDFSKYDMLKVTVVNSGKHSTISPAYIETIHLKRTYYSVSGNKNDLDVNTENVLTLNSKNTVPIDIKAATIKTPDDKVICNCDVRKNDIILPTTLSYNNTYKVYFRIEYHDENNEVQATEDAVFITTRANIERDTIIVNYEYENTLTLLEKYSADAPLANTVSTNIHYNTEEMFNNLVVMMGSDDKNLDTYIMDDESHIFNVVKNDLFKLEDDFTFRLITKTKAIVQYSNNKDDTLMISIIDYNPYTNKAKILKTINLDILSKYNDLIKFAEVSEDVYISGVNKKDSKNILVYKIDFDKNDIVKVNDYTAEYTITDITLATYKDSGFIINLIGKELYRMVIYNANDNDFILSLAIPSTFINKKYYSTRMKNGNILNIISDVETDKIETFVLNLKEHKVEMRTLEIERTAKVNSLIKLKNGNYILRLKCSDDKIHTYLYN